MVVLFKYRNALSSAEFNQRFADLAGRSILQGFYLEKGTGDFDLSIISGPDTSSLLIMKNGVRIEELGTLQDVIELPANGYAGERIDSIYVRYVHGTRDALVEYLAVPGTAEGEAAFSESEDTHTLIGYVTLPAGATVADATFSYPERGLHLDDVANAVEFKARTTFAKGVKLPAPVEPDDAVTKSYLDSSVFSGAEGFPYAEVVSSSYNPAGKLFETVAYKRQDGTSFMESRMSEPNVNGHYEKVNLIRFAADGITSIGEEDWELIYDELGNIQSKKRV